MLTSNWVMAFAKLAIVLLIVFLPILSQAQQPILEQTVTLNVSRVTLEEVINQLSEQTGLSFSYNPSKVPVDKLVTIQANQSSLRKVLEELTRQSSTEFEFVEGQVILRAVKKGASKSSNYTFSGYVKDEASGEALIGATVFVEDLKVGTVTNSYGYFSLTLPPGAYQLMFSFVGFANVSESLELGASSNRVIYLKENPPLLQEIVVEARSPTLLEENLMSKANLKPIDIEQKPALFGEWDAVKSLESQQGVKMHSDGSTYYYVRGGDRDQNLIMIDDAPIYNPSHLLGFFSTIIPDAVNDIDFYRGAMPASLGGRLSSVMDVRTKRGNDKNLSIWGNVGLISTKLGIEGPFKKNKSSYLVSGRLSRIKWIFKESAPDIEKFRFSDLTGKANFTLNDKNRLFFSFYTGSDSYLTSTGGIEWTNNAATIGWNNVISNRLFLNTTVAASAYDYFLNVDPVTNTRWNSHISNLNLKADFTYFIDPQQDLSFGASLNGYNFNPGNIASNGTNAGPITSVRNSGEAILFANHDVKINQRWGVNYGLRLSSWTNQGEAFEFIFDDNRNVIDTLYFEKGDRYKNYVRLEPRFTVSHFLQKNTTLKASYSRNVQNIHFISNSISPFTSLEVWLPSSINIKPQLSDQVSLGYQQFFDKAGLTFETEVYYKRMQNQIDYEPHAETLLNPLIESEMRFGETTSYGLETQMRKENGRLKGSVGYTYSRAQRRFKEINNGKAYNAFFDRPNQINMTLNYDLTLRWSLSLNYIYYTGAPFSSPVSFYKVNGLEVPIYGEKNNDRLPDYHRLDVAATLKLNKRAENRFKHELTVSLYNLYNRENIIFENYNKVQEGEEFKVKSNLLDNTQVPTQFYLFGLIPSLSYSFKWL